MNANSITIEWVEERISRIDSLQSSGEISHEERLLLLTTLKEIISSIRKDKASLAVIQTNAFWGVLQTLQKPTLEKELRSESGRHAANARHNLPMPTVKALKSEFNATQKKLGKDAKPTTVYKAMSKIILGDQKYWRRIRTQLEK